jgi:endonuclease-3
MVASLKISRKTTSRSERSHVAAKKRVGRILKHLQQSIPDPRVALDSSNPLELLVATILSAQCTDERVNQVTPNLFARYRTAEDFAKADQVELESLIRSTGFYKSKARNLIGCGKTLVATFHGKVPASMEALTTLPGVGRKTANVILGSYFGEPAVVVDTHVKRVANRLDLTKSQDPTKIEEDLQSLLPQSQWTNRCSLYDDCEWEGKLRRR